jgi:hypothetical protein
MTLVKTGFIFFMILPLCVAGQNIILLDRNLKEPIQFTDTLTAAHLHQGLFPIHQHDLTTMINTLNDMVRTIGMGKETRNKTYNFTNSYLALVVFNKAYPIGYRVILNTELGGYKTSIELLQPQSALKATVVQLENVLAYLKHNIAAFRNDLIYYKQ